MCVENDFTYCRFSWCFGSKTQLRGRQLKSRRRESLFAVQFSLDRHSVSQSCEDHTLQKRKDEMHQYIELRCLPHTGVPGRPLSILGFLTSCLVRIDPLPEDSGTRRCSSLFNCCVINIIVYSLLGVPATAFGFNYFELLTIRISIKECLRLCVTKRPDSPVTDATYHRRGILT